MKIALEQKLKANFCSICSACGDYKFSNLSHLCFIISPPPTPAPPAAPARATVAPAPVASAPASAPAPVAPTSVAPAPARVAPVPAPPSESTSVHTGEACNIATKSTYGSPEEGLVQRLQDHCREVHCPFWTLTTDERKTMKELKGHLMNKLNMLERLQVKSQGSMEKNTAIPGLADFDFILELKETSRDGLTLKELRNEVKVILGDQARFLYGEGKVLTFYCEDITFDVIISWSNEQLIQQAVDNLNDVVAKPGDQRDNYRAYMRALKYFCKRLDFPIKSFAVEYVALHLLHDNPNARLREFLQFLERGDWSVLLHCAPEIEDHMKDLKILATNHLRYLP
eukprot:gene3045-3324_t